MKERNCNIKTKKRAPHKFLTSLCGVSPLKKDTATPVNEMAAIAPTRPIPAHKSHPFRRLKGSFKSETMVHNINLTEPYALMDPQ